MSSSESIAAEVVAVVPTLQVSERLWRSVHSVQESLRGVDHAIVVVVNDPSVTGTQRGPRGVIVRGAGLNLGWAGGLHAGLLGSVCEYVWAVQDDMRVDPSTYGRLRRALDGDQHLGVVRPLPVPLREAGFVVPRDEVARIDLRAGQHLPSSGQLIRRSVWDAVGGYEPLLWPWGYIDVDFTRSLVEAGWACAHVTSANMHHEPGGSTNWNLRAHAQARNDELHRFKWDDQLRDPRLVSPMIVAEARHSRGRPREVTMESLHRWVGLSSTDAYLSVMRWMPDEPYEALRQLIHDPGSRRAFGRRLRVAVAKRVPRRGHP